MQTNPEQMCLENLAGGALVERFDIVLHEALDNIHDVNRDAEFVREITMKVKIKPAPDRERLAIGFEVTPKLAPLSAVITTAVTGKDIEGNSEAYEMKSYRQQPLPMNNVTPIDERRAEK